MGLYRVSYRIDRMDKPGESADLHLGTFSADSIDEMRKRVEATQGDLDDVSDDDVAAKEP